MDFAVLAKLAIVAIFPNVVTAGGPLEVTQFGYVRAIPGKQF